MIKGGKIQKANKKSLNAKGNYNVKGKGKDKKVYVPKPKNPKLIAKERPAKDDDCHHCKEVGHWKRNYHVYLAELIKKEKQVGTASSSDVFIIELFSFLTKSWVYDTIYGTHICNTKHGIGGIRKLKQVEAIGSFDLVLTNDIVICLDNCHYAPSITRGVVSVQICNKRAKRNLDSTYLWHCRLANINKKRIKQLQQDGLLKSTDDESFDQCESCLSGKMTKKPFPHTSATLILNMVPTKKVDKTPYEMWYGKVSNLSYLKVWGCEALVKRDTPDKLEQRFVKYLEEIQEQEDKSSFEITSNIPQEVEGFGPPPQEEEILIRRAIRILISIAAYYDYEIWQMDVKTAFLNGYLDEDIYTVQPEGFIDPNHPRKVCKLKRSIYGLKQASRSWNKRFDEEIKSTELRVECYYDAGFETDRDDTKSQTGYVFVLYRGAVDWKSSKQSTIAMSTTQSVQKLPWKLYRLGSLSQGLV
ncbi:retrotransposon protein, putative, ty1-copia subclass [Tanacetum coccineum]|uniref:Retrotransposon protein, putative, ty1-copia subclass n=1 Tax=Tanacetum coccineum TaxID=301880 RepID=A0ABQ5F5Z1_9ASTR